MEFQKDLLELRELLALAKQPRVRTLLEALVADTLKLVPVKEVPVEKPLLDKSQYKNITKYSWDQEGREVKIIVSLPEVKERCAGKVEVDFQAQGLDLRIHDYNGENLRLRIPKLQQKLKVGDCRWSLKNNSVSLVLVKEEYKHWAQLPFKEDTFKKNNEKEIEANPNAALMDMMKKMYEEGDADMKRTIAQAWSKSNQEKGKGK